jgi:hypothetical protein
MATAVHPDPHLSASHRAMADQLTGPFQAGAADEEVTISAAGRATVAGGREPLLLVAPSASLADTGLIVEAVLDPGGADTELEDVTFAPWTEAAAFVPLHRPPVAPGTGTAAGFVLDLRVRELRPDGSTALVPVGQTRNRITLTLLQGVLGRMLALLGSEAPRLRRQGRELLAARQLRFARDDALDRHGADLGVSRFADTLAVRNGQIVTDVERESDTAYRRRLGVYRPLLVPTRDRLLELLNGPGDPGDPNAGPIGEMGLQDRFSVLEADNELAVAVKIVGSGAGQHRANFLTYVRNAFLIWPANNQTAQDMHDDRFLPSTLRQRQKDLRTALRAHFSFEAEAAADPALAAPVATALIRAARCREELGLPGPWPIRRAQRADRGSRYELGLGADVASMTVGQLGKLGAQVNDQQRPAAADPEIESLISRMTPVSPATDPDGRWLLEPCGLRTVHRLAGGDLYVSPLPTHGLTIDAPASAGPAATVPVEGRYQAPGDPGANAVLAAALAQAATAWAAAGGAAWTELTDAQARARWDQTRSGAAVDSAQTIFRAAALPAVETPGPVVEALKRLPEELHATIRLDNALAGQIVNGTPAAATPLRALATILEQAGIAAVLPLVTGAPEIVLVVSVIGLPAAGVNLAQRRQTGFRWYVVPLQGDAGQIGTVGARTTYRGPATAGVCALVLLGYARRGLTDPYEHRVELPEGALLDPLQYEFTMNVLDHAYPMGVEVNTFAVRRTQVDLDGDGDADPLDPSAARTFRPFRRRRHRGEAVPTLEET